MTRWPRPPSSTAVVADDLPAGRAGTVRPVVSTDSSRLAGSNEHLNAHHQPPPRLEPCEASPHLVTNGPTAGFRQRQVGLRQLAGPGFDRVPVVCERIDGVLPQLALNSDVLKASVHEEE